MLAPKHGLICKVQKNWNLFKNLSCNLFIIAYQLTNLQAPSANRFYDIFADKFKKPKFAKAITLENNDGIRQSFIK